MIMNANGSQKYFKIKMEFVDSNHLLVLSCGAVYISPGFHSLFEFYNNFLISSLNNFREVLFTITLFFVT